MFKGYVFSLTVLWLMLAVATAWVLFVPSPKDFADYQLLMEYSEASTRPSSTSSAADSGNITQVAQQTRKQVSKQILFKKDQQRLQSRLYSDSSELSYGNKELGGELVENFNNVDCILQEKLLDSGNDKHASTELEMPIQFVRRIVADHAAYSYKTGLLEAYGVELAGYRFSGREWPIAISSTPPLFQGKARIIEVSLFQETSLKAQGFQGTLHAWGSGW